MASSTDRMSLLTNLLASPTEENKAKTMSLFADLLTENAKMSQKLTHRKSQKKKIGDLEHQLAVANADEEELRDEVQRYEKYAADLIDTYQAKQRTMRDEIDMLKIDVVGKTSAAEAQKALTDAKAKVLDESEGAVNDLRDQLAEARSEMLAVREQLDAAREFNAARNEATALREQHLRDQLAEKEGAF